MREEQRGYRGPAQTKGEAHTTITRTDQNHPPLGKEAGLVFDGREITHTTIFALTDSVPRREEGAKKGRSELSCSGLYLREFLYSQS